MKSNVRDLNLTEEQNLSGYWWTPDDKENERAGKFTFKPGESLELDLLGDHRFIKGQAKYIMPSIPEYKAVFLGRVLNNAHYITLLDNRGVYELPGSNVVQSIYRPKYLILSKSSYSPKDITLKSTYSAAEVIYSSLRGWMWSGFPLPENEEIYNRELMKFSVHSSDSNRTVDSTISLQERCRLHEDGSGDSRERESIIRVVPKKPQSIEWFRQQFHRIKTLLSFLSGTPIECQRFRAEPSDAESAGEYVDIFHHVTPQEKDEVISGFMPFPYRTLMGRTEDVFRSWFERSEDKRVPFEICMDVIYGQHKNWRIDFLSLVQALESYHQISTGTHNDRITLNSRLKSIFKCLPQDICDSLEIDQKYLGKIVLTRNYYTHYNPSHRLKAFQHYTLYDAITRLIPLVVAVLARDLCIPDPDVLNSFDSYPGLWGWPKIKEHELHSV